MVNAGNLFAHSGRRVIAANKLGTAGRLGEDAGVQERLRVAIQHAIGDRVVGKWQPRCRGWHSTGTIGAQISDSDGDCNDARITIGKSGRDYDAGSRAARIRILACQRDSLVGQAALDDAAPFHVVEEESWVLLPQRNLSSGVETINVKSQFSDCCRGGVEVVTCIESIVAAEPPCGSVELLGARLDRRGDGCGGGKAVLRTVVRRHVGEFRDCVQRRHDAGAAAAAVEVFAAIKELNIVAGSLTINTDVAVAANRCGDD
jgi:hypothetical protein